MAEKFLSNDAKDSTQVESRNKPIIQVSSLSKMYTRSQTEMYALRQVSFSVEEGDIYGIIGLSGAGKSTLLRSLATLDQPTTGVILFRGISLASLKSSALRAFRQKIGMVFQHFNLLSSRNVFENIAYPLEIAGISSEKIEERVKELLSLVGLSHKATSYPSELSGGEKQRVGIARALANRPEVLFCDEATSALDPQTTKEILTLLKNIHDALKITIILITHEMEVIKQICNKVAVIDKGEIVEKGEVIDVFSHPEHSITKSFLEKTSHALPKEFFERISPNRKLLKLTFKGEVAGDPIISEIVRKFEVDINILLGWIDRLQNSILGVLIIELQGKEQNIKETLEYLQNKLVDYEVLEK